MDFEPAYKRSRYVSEEHYIFYFEPRQGSWKGPALFDAAYSRNEEVHQLLAPLREEILKLPV